MRKLIVVLTVGCVVGFMCMITETRTAYAEKEVKMGILVAMSGAASVWGIPSTRTILLGADEINEMGGFKVKGETYKWKPMVYDTKMVPAESVKALNKAIYSDKIDFVSIQGGASVLGCLPLLKQNNMLSLNTAAGGKSITNPENPLVFRFNPSVEGYYAAALPYIQKKEGIKTIACINPDDESGKATFEAAEFITHQLDIKIIASEKFERGATKDFTPILTKIIALKPDLIETGMADPTSQALILKQARELGYKGPVFLFWGPDPGQVLKIAGDLAEGAYLGAPPSEPVTERQNAIYERFLKKYPAKEWNAVIYYCHNALFECLTSAIVKAQSFDSTVLAGTLEDVTWEDAYGTASFGGKKIFDIKRQMLQKVNLIKVINGKAEWLVSTGVPPGLLD
ncbi:MAG: ABC transporter substrate-binding protein [Syntrophales bacterium]|jgi:branched-chain amino acid transport system substrate-binding protein|nr:ABC transporter substrate-binding protein [Syntrophales bacterium]MDY0045253.1 ABC transporter substrate-binding protein [Syntrophales bacterium]